MKYSFRSLICWIIIPAIFLTGQSEASSYMVEEMYAEKFGVEPGTKLEINQNTLLPEVPIKVTSEESLEEFKEFYLQHKNSYCMPADITVEFVPDNWCGARCCEGKCRCEKDVLFRIGSVDVVSKINPYRCQCFIESVEM